MKKIIILIFSFALTACATCKCTDPEHDPYEPLNRKIFAFNMAIDRGLLKPLAEIYEIVVPNRVACSVGNFFDNIDDVTNVANNTLQFKLYDAWSDVWRVAFNTTFGVLGLFDVASCLGLPKHHQDFGLTLAYWGVTKAPYLMVPFYGPATIRDAIGWPIDWAYLSVWPYINPPTVRYSLYGLRIIHKRVAILPADKLIDDAIDPYVFVRDAYLQKRDCEIRETRHECAPAAQADANSDSDDTYIDESDDKSVQSKKDSDDPFVDEDESAAKKTSNKGAAKADPNDTFVE